MRKLIVRDSRNAERIYPYIGGEEVNTEPSQSHRRWVIDFNDFPLRRARSSRTWSAMTEADRARARSLGIVPLDYPGPTAADWPDLLDVVERLVKPERDRQKRPALRERWWQYADKRPGLRSATKDLHAVLAITQTSPHLAVSRLPTGMVFDQKLVVIADPSAAMFSNLQARIHEVWARSFASTMKDDLSYTHSDCFQTYPFPGNDFGIHSIGADYYLCRAQIMLAHTQGLTKTYNRFHDLTDRSPDIERLRDLHHAMDVAVLRAYGWDDLADRAAPEFLTEAAEPDHRYQGRLFWPAAFRDEVLARLLALNAERAAAERAAGLTPALHAVEAEALEETE